MEVSVAITSLIISIFSLVLACISLYFAHLRGPLLELEISSNPYIIQGFRGHGTIDEFFLRIVIANRGNSPGLLYSIDVENTDLVKIKELDFDPQNEMPMVINSGESFPSKLLLTMNRPEVKKNKYPTIKVNYTVSASLGRKRTKNELIELDCSKS